MPGSAFNFMVSCILNFQNALPEAYNSFFKQNFFKVNGSQMQSIKLMNIKSLKSFYSVKNYI